jgi:hypothetical protein
MYANTCWGFLSLAVSLGLAVFGLPADYVWLQPYFVWGAIVCALVSFALFGWPAIRKFKTPGGQTEGRSTTIGDIKVTAGDSNRIGDIGHRLGASLSEDRDGKGRPGGKKDR